MKTSNELYISDTAQDDKVSPKYGDAQVLVAGQEEKCEHYEKAGNQEKAYYDCCGQEDKPKEDKKVGNQVKEYYNE